MLCSSGSFKKTFHLREIRWNETLAFKTILTPSQCALSLDLSFGWWATVDGLKMATILMALCSPKTLISGFLSWKTTTMKQNKSKMQLFWTICPNVSLTRVRKPYVDLAPEIFVKQHFIKYINLVKWLLQWTIKHSHQLGITDLG